MTDLYLPSAIRVPDRRNVSSYNAGGPFRGIQHTTQPLGVWQRGRKLGAAIFSTLASAQRWFGNFGTPYQLLLCISELNSYDYFKSGPKKYQRDLESGPVREGFDALFQICPIDVMAWSMLGKSRGGYASNFVARLTPQLSIMGNAQDVPTWEDSVYQKIAAVWTEVYQLVRTQPGYEDEICRPYRPVGLGAAAAGSDGKGRMTVDEWMKAVNRQTGESWNLCGHADAPGRNPKGRGQSHWDPGVFKYDYVAELVNAALRGEGAASSHITAGGKTHVIDSAKQAAPPPAVTVPVGTINVGDTGSGKYTVPVAQTTVRPQQQGQAQHHIDNAIRDLNIAKKLLTPKTKGKKK